MSRIVFLAVIIVGLLSSISFGNYSGGTGVPNNPYQIANYADLTQLAANTGDYDKCFILTADIGLDPNLVFTAAVIAPDVNNANMVYDGTPFTGDFNGAGHKITHLTIHIDSNSFIGLFGCIGSNGSVKNLGLENCDISGFCYIGGLGGENDGNISDCCVMGIVSGYSVDIGPNGTSGFVGGLVGYNHNGIISNCSTVISMPVERTFGTVGGLVGYSNGGSISHCYSTGSVNCWFDYAGGLVGYNNGGYINDCCSTASAYALDVVGGLVAYNESGDINNCHTIISISAGGDHGYVGGLVGVNGSGNITNCDSNGIVGGGLWDTGGLIGNNNSGNVINCFFYGYVNSALETTGGLIGENYSGNIIDCCSICSVYCPGNAVGGLIGYNHYGNITDCDSYGSVNGNFDVGGLIGLNNSGTIVDCNSAGFVNGINTESNNIGGLVGWNGGGISVCYSTGKVISPYDSNNIGGLVGWNDGDISNCYSWSLVSGSSYVGGLVGYNNSEIFRCYSTGPVSGSSYVGGLVGYERICGVDDSVWDIQTSGQTTSACGEGKTTDEMHNINTYLSIGWDFVNYWQMPCVDCYPTLLVFNGPIDLATHPRPINGMTTGLYIGQAPDINLLWCPGAYAVSHNVYFGTNSGILQYVGTVAEPHITISDLNKDTQYYWRVDEVSGTNVCQGDVWSFTIGNFLVVDDFERYSDNASMYAKWKMGSVDYESCPYTNSNGVIDFDINDGQGRMQYDYDNGINFHFSEVRFDANNGSASGADWTGGDALPADNKCRSLAIGFIGNANNDADGDYDRMYAAIEDTAGNFGAVSNSDSQVQRTSVWTQWYIDLNDFNDLPSTSINLAHIRYLYLGFGDRCWYQGQNKGGNGRVRFDDIRLYQKVCLPQYGPVGDLTSDCKVDLADLDIMANAWLAQQTVISPVNNPGTTGLRLWYKFDETTGTTIADSSGNGFKGEVNSTPMFTDIDVTLTTNLWDPHGGYDGNGCYVSSPFAIADFNAYIDANSLALSPTQTSLTLSLWINGDPYMPLSCRPRIICAFQNMNTNSDDDNEVLEIQCPIPRAGTSSIARFRIGVLGVSDEVSSAGMPLSAFAGSWQHYAFVRDGDVNKIRIYHNGQMIANSDALMPLFKANIPIESFRLIRRNQSLGSWYGKIDDFRVYNRALSAAEIGWLGTKGTGNVPFSNASNLKSSTPEKISFNDMAMLAKNWLTEQLWPNP